jgi:Zn-dependent peptidase ImmA (M78 family)
MKMVGLFELIDLTVEYLGLEKPYTIKLNSKGKKSASAEYRAIYNRGDILVSHQITIYLGNQDTDSRDIETLIAHELVHAFQEEHNIEEIHGDDFIDVAGLLSMYLETAGIYVGNIYIEGTDV